MHASEDRSPPPPHLISRRDALGLIGLAGAAALTGCAGSGLGGSGSSAPLYDVSLAQWSLHKPLFAGGLDNLEFAETSARLGIFAIEYVNSFFKERAKDSAYLGEMNARASDAGVRQLLIMVDGEGALGDPDEGKRTRAIENHLRWLDAARTLGCHSIRVNAQSAGSYEEQMERAADGLARLTEHGAERGLNVIVENHGGLSSNGAWLAGVMQKVGNPSCGTLPDFGNFHLGGGEWYDRYDGVRELMPFAKAVSAKSHEFDADGNETGTDYRRMMRIVVDAGYRGYVGVEYEGSKHAPEDGIVLTKQLLERVRGELAD